MKIRWHMEMQLSSNPLKKELMVMLSSVLHGFNMR